MNDSLLKADKELFDCFEGKFKCITSSFTFPVAKGYCFIQ